MNYGNDRHRARVHQAWIEFYKDPSPRTLEIAEAMRADPNYITCLPAAYIGDQTFSETNQHQSYTDKHVDAFMPPGLTKEQFLSALLFLEDLKAAAQITAAGPLIDTAAKDRGKRMETIELDMRLGPRFHLYASSDREAMGKFPKLTTSSHTTYHPQAEEGKVVEYGCHIAGYLQTKLMDAIAKKCGD